MSARLKTALFACVFLITGFSGTAHAWKIWNQSGEYLYRPTATDDRPEPGVAPLPLSINYDLRKAPAGSAAVVTDAMNVWESVTGATVTFQNAGAVACCESGNNCNCGDGVNTVSWVENNWVWGAAALGVTFLENYDDTTGAVYEADMQINGQDHKWVVGAHPTASQFDLLSVIVHEMGHMLAFDDIYDYTFANSTMFGFTVGGTVSKATLENDDIDGLRFMYPATAGDLPPPFVTSIKSLLTGTENDKIIDTRGDFQNSVELHGFGFIEENAGATVELRIWQNGSPVSSPEITLKNFHDHSKMTVSIDFTGDAGEYDLVVINPDGQADLVPRAVEVNAPGNIAPTVQADENSNISVGKEKTVCAVATDAVGDGDGDAALVLTWVLEVKPQDSAALLNAAGDSCVKFTADEIGYYLIEVSASDGILTGYTDSTMVLARVKTSSGSSDGSGGGGGSSGGCAVIASDSEPSGAFFDVLVFIALTLCVFYLRSGYASAQRVGNETRPR